MELSHEDQYLVSECLREGVARCPFCYSYNLELGVVDETPIGRMLRRVVCRDCNETWTVEYEASRIQYKGKWYTRFEYWPTYTQVKNIKYQERFAKKHGIKEPWRADVEELAEYDDISTLIPDHIDLKKKRKNAIKRLIDYIW